MSRGRRGWGLAAVAAVVALGGCGAHHRTASDPPAPSTTDRSVSPSTVASTTTVPVAPLGASQTVTGAAGSAATVVLLKVVNPATASYSFEAPPPGQQYAAVVLQVTNTGGAPLTESALEDVSITDGNGHRLHSVIANVNECPSFPGGVVSLAPAAAASGCVAFELPAGGSISEVSFGLGGTAATAVARWRTS